jgi:TonB family protein
MLLFVTPSVLTAQSHTERLITDAYNQMRAAHLDSAETLLRPVLDSAAHPDAGDHAAALVLHGVILYLRGRDSTAAAAFHEALELRNGLHGDWMAAVDSSLWRLWRRERSRVICNSEPADTIPVVHEDSRVLTVKPRVLSGPRLMYPRELLAERVQGRVLIAAVIDTAGRAERGSPKVLESPHRQLSEEALHYVERARFQPGRVGDRLVRVCIELPVDFRIRN